MVINYIADELCMSDPVGHAESVTKNLTLSSIKKYEEASFEVNDLELDLRGI